MQYVAVLTSAEWLECKDSFDMGIDIEPDSSDIHSTKAEVNYDSLTGTFSVPDRNDISAPCTNFAFALDEKGIVFIDDSGKAEFRFYGNGKQTHLSVRAEGIATDGTLLTGQSMPEDR